MAPSGPQQDKSTGSPCGVTYCLHIAFGQIDGAVGETPGAILVPSRP
jgi:hypothetical protein